MRRLALPVAFLAAILLLPSPAARAAQEEVLTNASVIELVRLKFSDDIVVQKIESSRCDFDLSVAGLKGLKSAGVSERVISAMLETQGGSPAPRARKAEPAPSSKAAPAAAPATPAAAGAPVRFDADPERGVYYESKGKRVRLTRSNAEIAAKGVWSSAFSFGAKKHRVVALLAGPKAELRVAGRLPVFYYVPGSTEMTADDLKIARTAVREGSREVVWLEGKTVTTSLPDEYAQPFRSERVQPGVYRITFEGDLAPGEFAFVDGGLDKLYAFGVDG
jgi:hypothetical protein